MHIFPETQEEEANTNVVPEYQSKCSIGFYDKRIPNKVNPDCPIPENSPLIPSQHYNPI